MPDEPWWKLTRTQRQARLLGLVYAGLAAAMWTLCLVTDPPLWQYLIALAWTLLAAAYVATWTRWQPSWDEGRRR